MRTSATTPGSMATHRNPSFHRPARPQGPRLARTTLSTLLLLAVLAIAPSVALAGDITYTWNEDDGKTVNGQPVNGQLTVTSSVQAAGDISIPNDVVSFNFTVPILLQATNIQTPETFKAPDLQPGTLPISTIDASPDSPIMNLGATITPVSSVLGIWGLSIGFGPSSIQKNMAEWTSIDKVTGFGGILVTTDTGYGHWSITGASVTSVPEPSTAVLLAYGALAGLAYGWFRHRDQRQQRPVGPPEEVE